MATLSQESITFGKYDGQTLPVMLRDRQYCIWLLKQDWFKTNYPYLYNRVKEYKPLSFFINSNFQLESKPEAQPFLTSYTFFNLKNPEVEPIEILNSDEKRCYQFYFKIVESLKAQIQSNIENEEDNPYDITTPNKWLIQFEAETGLTRDFLKEFLSAYELMNITSIVEDIKRQGGISYQGANSFKIAKQRSKEQESWWERVLKSKYGEHIATQFKFKNCIFDFINIQTNTIFECKLNLKDFNEEQFEKYKVILNKFRLIYLISTDCVIHIDKKVIYTTDIHRYFLYINALSGNRRLSYLDSLIQGFKIIKVDDITSLFGRR